MAAFGICHLSFGEVEPSRPDIVWSRLMERSDLKPSLNDLSLAHALARIALGINLLGHGIIRIGNIPGFAATMQKTFEKTWIPAPLTTLVGDIIPPLELVFGIVLIAGWYLRPALIGGTLFMILLLFGATQLQNWTIASEQMIYVAFFAALLATASWDRFSLDSASHRK
jgi:thiosulfate dehydrogenase [quinone] large subunit